MADSQDLIETFEARARRRESRRAFFVNAAAAAAGVGAFAYANAAAAQTAVTDADVLNFALNLEYLEANFYALAVTGSPLAAADIDGVSNSTSGVQGTVLSSPNSQVNFASDPAIGQYAREIYEDELAHVRFLRSAGALGAAKVAQPQIDLRGGANTPFGNAAAAAGLDPNFSPYASPEAFLLGAYIFEDVGVTAYKGAAPLITNATFLEAAAGILAVEAYHAAIVRSTLYRKGIETPTSQLIEATTAISRARDSLDGRPTEDLVRGIAPNDDFGVAPTTTSDGTVANIFPGNVNGIAYSRSAGQTLNIVYLTASQTTSGGFFPAGVNGTIRTSAAST
jgi:hypothetical protein